MNDIYFSLKSQMEASLRAGELDACDALLLRALDGTASSPFHVCRDLYFSNSPASVADHFDTLFAREIEHYPIKAAYAEMNGFSINPNRWFFDIFTFDSYGGLEDLDWLSDWQSEIYHSMTLTGMEDLQKVFASPLFRDGSFEETALISELLVEIRYQKLIGIAFTHMKRRDFPILATSHDSDAIAEFSR